MLLTWSLRLCSTCLATMQRKTQIGIRGSATIQKSVRTPMTLQAERFNLTPTHGNSDSGIFDFDGLEAKSPSEASEEIAIDHRGEDAHERFRISELRIVQENVKKIEAEGDDDDDDECPHLDGQFSDTDDENSTNASFVPGCGAETVEFVIACDVDSSPIELHRVRGLIPRRILTPSARMRPGWSLPC